MDKSLEVTNIKIELTKSTSIDRVKIPTEMQVKSVKQESDCLVQSKIYIKKELQEGERDAQVIEDTSFETCSHDNIKFTTIKIECKNLDEDIMQDPLDVSDETKDKELTQEERNENVIKTDQNVSHGCGSNQSQDPLLIRNTDRKYICNECKKTFPGKSNLENHLRIHTGEKPFTCDVCAKSFNQKTNLKIHMLIHSGAKTHVCDVCKKVFGLKSNLNVHKLIHSGKKSFSCDVCDKSFTHKANVVVHKRIHTGDKPFACNICKKAFVHESHLTQHRRLHTGEKPYSCDICHKSFVTRSNLNSHKRIHKK